MGGKGSGRPPLSDKEKKAKGTFRQDRSEQSRAVEQAKKVVVGPWLTKAPVPSLPLDKNGKAKYSALTKLLLESNKLTTVTADDCERMAVMYQQMHARLTAGKPVSMDLIKRMDSISVRLRIAEDATPIANPNERNPFSGSGFSNDRTSPIRLRRIGETGED